MNSTRVPELTPLFPPQKQTVEDMCCFNPKPPKKAILAATTDDLNKVVVDLFAKVMVYMGDAQDKKAKSGSYMLLSDICSGCVDGHNEGISKVLQEEVLIFLLIQSSSTNPCPESVARGIEIILQMLTSPSIPTSSPILDLLRKTMLRRRQMQSEEGGLAVVCFWELLMIGAGRGRELERLTVDHFEFARTQCIVKPHPFDCTLEQVLRCEHHAANPLSMANPLQLFSLNLWVPRILSGLIEVVKCLGGLTTQGIFRLASDKDDVIALKNEICSDGYAMIADVIRRKGELGKKRDENLSAIEALNIKDDVYTGISFGSSIEASDLIKQWLRSLSDPLIPYAFYNEALEAGRSSDLKATAAVFRALLKANQACLDYLCDFLVQMLEYKDTTLMDDAGLAIVFSPNVLRNPKDDPMLFAMNSENEKRFVINLIHAKKKGWLLKD